MGYEKALTDQVIASAYAKLSIAAVTGDPGDDVKAVVHSWAMQHSAWIESKQRSGWGPSEFTEALGKRFQIAQSMPTTQEQVGNGFGGASVSSQEASSQRTGLSANSIQSSLALCNDNNNC